MNLVPMAGKTEREATPLKIFSLNVSGIRDKMKNVN